VKTNEMTRFVSLVFQELSNLLTEHSGFNAVGEDDRIIPNRSELIRAKLQERAESLGPDNGKFLADLNEWAGHLVQSLNRKTLNNASRLSDATITILRSHDYELGISSLTLTLRVLCDQGYWNLAARCIDDVISSGSTESSKVLILPALSFILRHSDVAAELSPQTWTFVERSVDMIQPRMSTTATHYFEHAISNARKTRDGHDRLS
jgi:hypothetical protein